MAEDNRAKVLSLAVAAIDAGGEAAIRVNHLAAEAGVTPPVIYYHFDSRDGLVIAAQIERYSRRILEDTAAIGAIVDRCTSRDELRETLIATWRRIIAERRDSRWTRISVTGSAYARPELEAELARVQDEIIAGLVGILEPSRIRGWLKPDIDLVTAVAWQHSMLFGRVFVERGEELVDLDQWNELTIDAFVRVFFGD